MGAWKGPLALLIASFMACGGDSLGTDADAGADAGDGAVSPEPPISMMDGEPSPRDTDGDGLCDRTERQLATDAEVADSDADGLPDLVEARTGFDPVNPKVPAEDQVASLIGEPGAMLDFPVRLTVDGDGTTLSGYFEAIGSSYVDRMNAGDFVQGTTATEANPIDGVRRVDSGSARFTGVLGRTRLSFSVRFAYPSDAAPSVCANAYPLRYSLKSEDGSTVAERLFLLVVAPRPTSETAPAFCSPSSCM